MSHYPHIHRREGDPVDADFERLPPGMTEEQLAFFTEQTQRACEQGTRRGVAAYLRGAVVGFLILFIGVLIANTLAVRNGERIGQQSNDARQALVQSGRTVSVSGCNRDYVDREKFRGLLLRLKEAAAASFKAGRSTPQQYQMAVDFYNDQLESFPAIDCRLSLTVITDDPNDTTPIPEPCYKDNPNNPEDCEAPAAVPERAPKPG